MYCTRCKQGYTLQLKNVNCLARKAAGLFAVQSVPQICCIIKFLCFAAGKLLLLLLPYAQQLAYADPLQHLQCSCCTLHAVLYTAERPNGIFNVINARVMR
jgi:hypothetical protein